MKPNPSLSGLARLVAVPCILASMTSSALGAEAEVKDAALAAQRSAFLAAETALKTGALERYRQLAGGLAGYPLYPYLRYEELSRAPAGPGDQEVQGFLADYPDSPLAERLRAAWLMRLAGGSRWAEYAQAYRPEGSPERSPEGSEERQCLYRRALLETGRRAEAFAGLEGLWLRAESGPSACGPVFDAWATAGGLTPDLVWRRVALALGADRPKAAAGLGRYLPAADRSYLDLWLALHRDPGRASDPAVFSEPHPWRGELIRHTLARLAARAPQAAAEAWDRLSAAAVISGPEADAGNAAVGLALAEAGMSEGLSRLDQVPASAENLELQGRRLRAALKLGDWGRVAAWVAAMPPGDTKTDLWLYWQARAEEALGHRDAAEDLYRQAADARSLWGFLAAERMGLPYRLDARATPADPERVARLKASPALARIGELKALDRTADMRREWTRLTADLGPEDLMAAAVVAKGLDWPDQAIRTLAKSGYWDDLELRFPLGYRGLVRAQSAATGLPDAWIFAVLREESAFDRGAGSAAGAIGLMQLLPETARSVAAAAALRPPSRGELLDPGINIRLGSTYLATMGARYGGHPALVAAAYNAGPHRVDQWLPASPMPADLWIATIAFRETRDYVRRVLAYSVIYADRLGVCQAPIGAVLGPVAAAPAPSDAQARTQASAQAGVVASAQANAP